MSDQAKLQAKLFGVSPKRGLLCLKIGVFKAFYYGDTLIGCSSPDGDYKLALSTMYNQRERATLKAKMDECNLNCGWVGPVSSGELAEIVYKGWLLNFAAHARERMQGGEPIA